MSIKIEITNEQVADGLDYIAEQIEDTAALVREGEYDAFRAVEALIDLLSVGLSTVWPSLAFLFSVLTQPAQDLVESLVESAQKTDEEKQAVAAELVSEAVEALEEAEQRIAEGREGWPFRTRDDVLLKRATRKLDRAEELDPEIVINDELRDRIAAALVADE